MISIKINTQTNGSIDLEYLDSKAILAGASGAIVITQENRLQTIPNAEHVTDFKALLVFNQADKNYLFKLKVKDELELYFKELQDYMEANECTITFSIQNDNETQFTCMKLDKGINGLQESTLQEANNAHANFAFDTKTKYMVVPKSRIIEQEKQRAKKQLQERLDFLHSISGLSHIKFNLVDGDKIAVGVNNQQGVILEPTALTQPTAIIYKDRIEAVQTYEKYVELFGDPSDSDQTKQKQEALLENQEIQGYIVAPTSHEYGVGVTMLIKDFDFMLDFTQIPSMVKKNKTYHCMIYSLIKDEPGMHFFYGYMIENGQMSPYIVRKLNPEMLRNAYLTRDPQIDFLTYSNSIGKKVTDKVNEAQIKALKKFLPIDGDMGENVSFLLGDFIVPKDQKAINHESGKYYLIDKAAATDLKGTITYYPLDGKPKRLFTFDNKTFYKQKEIDPKVWAFFR